MPHEGYNLQLRSWQKEVFEQEDPLPLTSNRIAIYTNI